MIVKCLMCSKEVELTKMHKDYKKLAANPQATYICESCSLLIAKQAAHGNVLEKK